MRKFVALIAILFAGAAGATTIDLSPESCGVQQPECFSVPNDAGAHVTFYGTSTSVFLFLNGTVYSANVQWQQIANGVTLQAADCTSVVLTGTFTIHTNCFTGGRGAGCRKVIYFNGGTIS